MSTASAWSTATAHSAQADSSGGTGCPDSSEHKSSDKKPVATGNIAMRDLRWKDFFHGEHRNEILEAHKKEFDGLTGTILKELFPGDAEYKAAQRGTNCRLIRRRRRGPGTWGSAGGQSPPAPFPMFLSHSSTIK